jgi:hypothetical protein
MRTVTSKDGTTVAFDRLGQGPPVVLVCGGSVDPWPTGETVHGITRQCLWSSWPGNPSSLG